MRLISIGLGAGVAAAVLAGALTGADPLPRPDPPIGTGPAQSYHPSGRTVAARTDSVMVTAFDPTVAMARASAPLRRFTVVMSGDVLLHSTLWSQARRDAQAAGRAGFDFRPLLAGVRPAVRTADLAICHLETPLGPPGGPFSGYPIFSVPPRIAPDLAWAGYDACTTASNHTLDGGVSGVRRTLAALDSAGLGHAGSARTVSEAGRIMTLHAAGARIALLSYTYGLNGFVRPADRPWIVQLIDADQILADAAEARRAGADVVLVALHWGNEYQQEPSDSQRELAARLLASPDIDLVYGHHAHVVQPFERIGGKWVAYGLGNHVAEQSTADQATHEGVLARFEFTATASGDWVVTAAEYLPTVVSSSAPYRLVDLTRMLAGGHRIGADRRHEFERAYRRISAAVNGLDADRDGLRPADLS
ncbi:MAG TPA: CapA family protein [Actinomycetes bacterium]|nr:CapA family protein [Actinomycetes bacterium]